MTADPVAIITTTTTLASCYQLCLLSVVGPNWHWCETCIVQPSGIGSSLTNEDETFDTMNIPSAMIRSTSIVIISINNNKKKVKQNNYVLHAGRRHFYILFIHDRKRRLTCKLRVKKRNAFSSIRTGTVPAINYLFHFFSPSLFFAAVYYIWHV